MSIYFFRKNRKKYLENSMVVCGCRKKMLVMAGITWGMRYMTAYMTHDKKRGYDFS